MAQNILGSPDRLYPTTVPLLVELPVPTEIPYPYAFGPMPYTAQEWSGNYQCYLDWQTLQSYVLPAIKSYGSNPNWASQLNTALQNGAKWSGVAFTYNGVTYNP